MSTIPIGKNKKYVIKTLVKNLNLKYVRPQRAGVIIYATENGNTFFGMGIDSKTHDLTDFGGGISYKKDKNVINGALREFDEETLGIFESLKMENIVDCPVIYDDKNLIIFIHLNVDPNEVCSRFNTIYKKNSEAEVCGITWLNWEDFQDIIENKGKLFGRVRNFMNRAGDFSYLL